MVVLGLPGRKRCTLPGNLSLFLVRTMGTTIVVSEERTVNRDETTRVIKALHARGMVVCLACEAVETNPSQGGFYPFDSVCCVDGIVNSIVRD